MWVIYDTDTGVELDRIEGYHEAVNTVATLNRDAAYDHYAKRWED